MIPDPGDRIDDYQIVSELGTGGMGKVYKAKDLKLGRLVAIKVLLRNLLSDPRSIWQFEQEARAASTLNHPNIVTIYRIGEYDGSPYIAMEYVAGQTLREMLRGGPLIVEDLLDCAIQIANGLANAHGRGIVHRDLKPENVLISSDGCAKIVDFGLAKILREDSFGGEESLSTAAAITAPGTILGTIGYMSPEQAKSEPVDFRSDQFSFGAILYEMATGERAFKKKSAAETLACILHDNPPTIRKELPDRLIQVIDRCLEKLPDKRYPTSGELLDDLSRQKELTPSHRGRPKLNSIAVLPFRDLNPEAGEQYFADAMTDALITELAKIRALKVISRTSVMRFRDSTDSLRQIARVLGVDAVLEGAVLRAGNRVRISGQLVEAATDLHLWAENYERNLHDILRLQSEVARTVAQQVQAQLSPEEEGRFASRPQIDPASHDAYARGRYYFYQWSKPNFEKAIQYFRRAIDMDPGSAAAYAGLADAYILLSVFGYLPPRDTAPQASAAAQKAVELDESCGEAWSSIGSAQFVFDWDWDIAESNICRAIELAPNNVNAFIPYAVVSVVLGQPDDGIAAAERACQIDPLSGTTANHLGFCQYLSRRYRDAVIQFEKAISLSPDYHLPHVYLACSHAICERFDDALAEASHALSKLRVDDGLALSMLGWIMARIGKREESVQLLHRISRCDHGWRDPSFFATIHAGLGDNDRALEFLKEAYNQRSPRMVYLATDPLLDGLRGHDEFEKLIQQMNFPA